MKRGCIMMSVFQDLKKRSFTKALMLTLGLLTTSSYVSRAEESSLSRQEIDIFRKEVSQSELNALDASLSKEGKKAICHLSNKNKKMIWVDEKVLDKIEESTVLEALQKGFRDTNLICDFKSMKTKSGKFDGVVAYPQNGQVVFYDVTSQK